MTNRQATFTKICGVTLILIGAVTIAVSAASWFGSSIHHEYPGQRWHYMGGYILEKLPYDSLLLAGVALLVLNRKAVRRHNS